MTAYLSAFTELRSRLRMRIKNRLERRESWMSAIFIDGLLLLFSTVSVVVVGCGWFGHLAMRRPEHGCFLLKQSIMQMAADPCIFWARQQRPSRIRVVFVSVSFLVV